MKKTIMLGLIFLIILTTMVIADDKSDILETLDTYYSASASEDFSTYYSVISQDGYSGSKLAEKKANTKIIWQNYDTLSYELSNILVDVQDDVATAEYDISASISHVDGESVDYESKMVAIFFKESGWKVWAVMSKANFDLKMRMYSFNLDEVCQDDCDVQDEEPGFFSKVKNFFSGLVNKVIKGGTCGNGVCDNSENSDSCNKDCPNIVKETVVKVETVCGNNLCEGDETFANCANDCKEPEVLVPVKTDYKSKPEKDEDETKTEVLKQDEPKPTQDNKSELVVCGDEICQETENCESCADDCGCETSEVCFNRKCYLPKCTEDSDCDDTRDSTKDVCEYAGEAFAKCEYSSITRCKDGDGYCPDDCTEADDDDCGDSDDDDSDSSGSSSDEWTTGSDTLTVGEDHDFFDFSAGDNTANYNDGDIFTNSFGDLVGECSDDNCAQIKETTQSFNSMTSPPSSGYDGSVETVSDGARFWIKTLEGKYAKLEVTDIDTSDDLVTSISFKWGYQG